MKRIVSSLLVTALCTALFAGCTGDTKSEGGATDMLLWLPPQTSSDALDGEFWEGALAPWAEENNVNLSIEITPWGGYEEKYLTGFSSGEGPDVGYMYLEMFNDFIDMGTIADIGSYFTQEEIDNYIYYDNGYMKGGQYALPFVVGNARVPFFNMDLLAQAGITEEPTTWDELIEAAVAVKNANIEGVIPFAQGWAHPSIGELNQAYYPFLWQAGGEIYNEDGTEVALMDNDAAVRAAQLIHDLRFKYEVMPDECLAITGDQVRDEFLKGRVAITCLGTGTAKAMDEAGLNWSFIQSYEDKTKAAWFASDSLVMSEDCEDKELAASLMKEITSADVMEQYHTKISPFSPITKDAEYLDNEAFKDMYENQTEHFRTLPVAEGSFKVMDALYKNLQLLVLGDLTPEEAISQTVEYAESIS